MSDSSYKSLTVPGKVIEDIIHHEENIIHHTSLDRLLEECKDLSFINGSCFYQDPENPLPSCCHKWLTYNLQSPTISGSSFSVSSFEAMSVDEWVEEYNEPCLDMIVATNPSRNVGLVDALGGGGQIASGGAGGEAGGAGSRCGRWQGSGEQGERCGEQEQGPSGD